jgi:hypothetical protein
LPASTVPVSVPTDETKSPKVQLADLALDPHAQLVGPWSATRSRAAGLGIEERLGEIGVAALADARDLQTRPGFEVQLRRRAPDRLAETSPRSSSTFTWAAGSGTRTLFSK